MRTEKNRHHMGKEGHEFSETQSKLIDDLKALVRDGEDLLNAGVGEVNERSRAARERLSQTLQDAKATCQEFEGRTVDRVRAVARDTDQSIRQHPYRSIGIACGVGMLIALLMRKK